MERDALVRRETNTWDLRPLSPVFDFNRPKKSMSTEEVRNDMNNMFTGAIGIKMDDDLHRSTLDFESFAEIKMRKMNEIERISSTKLVGLGEVLWNQNWNDNELMKWRNIDLYRLIIDSFVLNKQIV